MTTTKNINKVQTLPYECYSVQPASISKIMIFGKAQSMIKYVYFG